MKYGLKIAFGILGVSNVLVISFVSWTLFQNRSEVNLSYSKAESQNSIEKQVRQKCSKEIQEVAIGKRKLFICNVKLNKTKKDSSYQLGTRILIKKESGKITISGTGNMLSETGYATESGFCTSCVEKSEFSQTNDLPTIMQQFVHVAQLIEERAANDVVNGKEKAINKAKIIKAGKAKASRCLGDWNDALETFEEFDNEEKIECKISKVKSHFNLWNAETEYNKSQLKDDLWKLARSEDHYSVSDHLESLMKSPLQRSLSAKTSFDFLKRYTNWKDSYEDDGPTEDLYHSLQGIINDAKILNTSNQYDEDIKNLNQSYNQDVKPFVGTETYVVLKDSPKTVLKPVKKIPFRTNKPVMSPTELKSKTNYLHNY